MKKFMCSLMVISSVLIAEPFIKDGNMKTVIDVGNGLEWQDIGSIGIWETAISYCENLTLAYYDDWRLPNINEVLSLAINIPYTHLPYPQFATSTTWQYGSYPMWSSTTDASNTNNALSYSWGKVTSTTKTNNLIAIRCVRTRN